jgi:hypothetical protein
MSTSWKNDGNQNLTKKRERFPSGQREQTVNLSAEAFGGSNPPLSTIILKILDFQNYQQPVTRNNERERNLPLAIRASLKVKGNFKEYWIF